MNSCNIGLEYFNITNTFMVSGMYLCVRTLFVFQLQDVVTRYAHQSGFHVERRFGWDCHGLPVEYEIDKTLGIKVA